jgi:large subunit ribosomal protein L1
VRGSLCDVLASPHGHCASCRMQAHRLKVFSPELAIRLIKSTSTVTTFTESVDLALVLSVDPRRPNQQVRGNAQLPHGVGKRPVIAVFAKGDQAQAARDAGADIVGAEELIDKVKAGEIMFSKCLATPDMMPALSKVARILGPKGLMPNVKLGTIVHEVGPAVQMALQGQVSFRAEKHGTLHGPLGLISFSDSHLMQNLEAFVKAVSEAKPSGAPTNVNFIKGAALSSTRGVGFKLDLDSFPFK